MLRLDYPEIAANQVSIIESLLPPEILKLPADLEKVDQILKDESFEEPFIERFNVTIGRGSVPIRPYIRLMVLKYSTVWGYETLESKVNDSLTLKKFCRIPLDKCAPDSTTLIKLNQKCGEDVIKELNQKLMKHLTQRKIIRGRKLRVDTTVVESNTHYPSDANLLKDCVDAVAKTVKKIKCVSKEATNGFRSGARKVKQQLLKVVKVLNRRTGKSQQEVKAIVDEMVQTAKESHKAGRKVLDKLGKKDTEESRRLSKRLSDTLDTVAAIIKQTEEVQSGVGRHEETFGHVPDAVTADRGYGAKDNESKLKDAGVKKVVYLPRGRNPKPVRNWKRADGLEAWSDGEQGRKQKSVSLNGNTVLTVVFPVGTAVQAHGLVGVF